eukprot:6175288-Pleurochrysis_carterae.AAC.6
MPTAIEPTKMRQKAPTMAKKSSTPNSCQPSIPMVVFVPSETTVLNRTIAIASLSTDSPKMSACSRASAPTERKTERIATGSTATISAAKAAASIGVNMPPSPPSPK